jgi:hypothetical protein
MLGAINALAECRQGGFRHGVLLLRSRSISSRQGSGHTAVGLSCSSNTDGVGERVGMKGKVCLAAIAGGVVVCSRVARALCTAAGKRWLLRRHQVMS